MAISILIVFAENFFAHVVNVPRDVVELSLERNFDRTLSQLERVQRMRLGQPVFPKLKGHFPLSRADIPPCTGPTFAYAA